MSNKYWLYTGKEVVHILIVSENEQESAIACGTRETPTMGGFQEDLTNLRDVTCKRCIRWWRRNGKKKLKDTTRVDRVFTQYPELKGMSKKARITKYINECTPFGQNDNLSTLDHAKIISESAYNHFVWVRSDLQVGELEDCDEDYIMEVARTMGYTCATSNLGGVLIRKLKVV